MTVNPTTKFSSLTLQWASHNNCIQRAGRVGRVSSGRVYRLVPYEFYMTQMQENTTPELQRAPLENVILYMKLLELNDTPKNVLSLAISPPNLKDVETCIWHLKEVGALLPTCRGNVTSADGDLTFMGRVMGSLPIDIRMSKLILLGHMFSCLDDAVIMAAGCMTKNIFVHNFTDRFKCYRKKLVWADGACCDFMIYLNLHEVWLTNKRQHAFRTVNDENAWCKTNFVNLKGLREWDILIREIQGRLKRLGIENRPSRPEAGTDRRARSILSPVEKPTVLKIVICGAFYPNYFVRSSDFGQIDSKAAVKTLNGRDPFNTVYFLNMKMNQPGHIYVRQIKELLQVDDTQNVRIGFDPQSTKVFVEYKHVKDPEAVTVGGKQYITTVGGHISINVYEAVRKRQLNVPFRLRILPDHKAWEFANEMEQKQEKRRSRNEEEFNCFTEIDYSPLPSLDIEYITITVTHIVDAGYFYCQNWNEETRLMLGKIFTALNSPGTFLELVEGKIEVNGKIYAAKFNDDGKMYRCKVLKLTPGRPDLAHVEFIDYGNTQRVPSTFLHKLPENCPECKVQPIAMCCCLSEVQPHLVRSPNGLWPERVNDIFRKRTERVLLNAKVYSVVDNIVHMELYQQKQGLNALSFNKWLIEQGFGQKCEESQRSKMDHELRQKVLNSEDPNNVSNLYKEGTNITTNYTDYEAPSTSEATDVVHLKGPYSPLEMKVCGLVQASVGAAVHIDGDSVNAVLLDNNPEDPHARLLVAANVSQSSFTRTIKLSQTTLMPSIPGLPMLVSLLFCPQMEPKLTPDGCRVASILCGLGCKEFSEKANFPMHDISLTLDTDLQAEIITQVNKIRYLMNSAIKTMNNLFYEIDYYEDLVAVQTSLKHEFFNLLHMRQKSVTRIGVEHSDVWKKIGDDVEILQMTVEDDPLDIWRMLWFVKLNEDKHRKTTINKNLEELSDIAKKLAPERKIQCELCGGVVLKNVDDVRIHLFKMQHKNNLARYKAT